MAIVAYILIGLIVGFSVGCKATWKSAARDMRDNIKAKRFEFEGKIYEIEKVED